MRQKIKAHDEVQDLIFGSASLNQVAEQKYYIYTSNFVKS
jgi:hypothetical protein